MYNIMGIFVVEIFCMVFSIFFGQVFVIVVLYLLVMNKYLFKMSYMKRDVFFDFLNIILRY